MTGSESLTAARGVEARTWHRGTAVEQAGEVAELLWSDGRVVQISSYPNSNDGVLIRVWGENGTAETGGDNLTLLSAALRFTDDGGIEIQSLDVRKRSF